jgi:uncharacterized damage-inducible protein DinB
MDRTAIEELFAFTDFSWRTHAEAVGELGDDALVKPVPGSGWPAPRDAFTHINWAYERWLADPNGTTDAPLDVESVRTWGDIERYRRKVRSHCREYLDSLSDSELATPRQMNIDGDILAFSRADILAHVLLHERQHHGDINTLLYQMGVEAPIVEYRFYLMEARA